MTHPKESGPRDNLVPEIGGNILLLETLTPIGRAIHAEKIGAPKAFTSVNEISDTNSLGVMPCTPG
jgi:hypothetical protein